SSIRPNGQDVLRPLRPGRKRQMSTSLDAPLSSESLDRLLRPARIALVGASDKNLFSRRAFAQPQRVAPGRPLPLVNPRTAVVHGTATVASCQDIDGGVDCVFLMTPAQATRAALDD